MIRVTHQHHSITPPMELTNMLQYFGTIAYLAKELGDSNLFNQAKEQYQSIASSWYSKAKAEVEGKSHRNWLGGGETYSVFQPQDFEDGFSFGKTVFSSMSKQQQMLALKFLLARTKVDFDTIGNAYQFVMNNF